MKRNKSCIPVALSYVGAFVGAGFISGQELSQFVLRFGLVGWLIWFAIVSTISAAGGFFLSWLANKKYSSFNQLVLMNFNKSGVWIVNLVINGYLLGGLVIMISGASTMISEIAGLPMWLAVMTVGSLITLVVFGEGKRVLGVNNFLVPILMILTLFVSLLIIQSNIGQFNFDQEIVIKNPSPLLFHPIISFLLYIGYNAIGAMVALLNIASETNPSSGFKGGLIGGLIISLLGTMILLAMWLTYPEWTNFDLPFTQVVRQNSNLLYMLFVPSILIAMFTVAVAYSLGMTKFLAEKLGTRPKITGLIMMSIVSPAAVLGFSKLLGLIYPFFGIMATLIVIYLLFIKIKGFLYVNTSNRTQRTIV